ncbi:inositol monophosphatase family protein [Niallia sp. 01092]|uniref:inositol monophosphatase family protein n=1 Tax=unclassified Niallia TaxID=2837522 RepID=UPI003FD597CB
MTLEMKQDLEYTLYHMAIEYAKQAGSLIKENIGNMGEVVQKKNASDLVTEVDQMTEKMLRQKIKQDFPDHWILSEEDCGQANSYQAFQQFDSGYGWIIDPIDGTTNFIHGIPYYSVSIGIVNNKEPVIGVVLNPMTGELYTARKSMGSFLNEQPLRVGQEMKLTEAIVSTGFQANDFKVGSRVLQQMDKLAGNSRNIRMFGASSLDLCQVASGRLTGFWHEGLNPWDTAAGILIVTEAGGTVTDKDGNPYKLFHESLVASNGNIHNDLLNTIKLK